MALLNKLPDKSWRIPWHLVLIFSLLSGGILTVGYFYHKYQEAFFQREKEAELNTIADLKIKQILTWRLERMHDARLIFDDPLLAAEIHGWLNDEGSPRQRDNILHHLSGLKQEFYEAIALFDTQGAARLSVPGLNPELLPFMKAASGEAISTGEIVFTDLYFIPKINKIYSSLAIPIRFQEQGKGEIVGAVVYQIDPHHFLYPILESWPTPSKTGELVMVRRSAKGDKIEFLNELRHLKGTALVLTKSLSESQMPCVKAVLGQEGIVGGTDYRGVPILAANRIIPDSPWFLTAKIDISEVNTPLRERSLLIAILIVALVATAGLGIAFIWRNRDAQFYQQQYLSESERRGLLQRYEYLAKYANDIILVMDQDWKIVEANDRAAAAYGYERDELFSLHLRNLFLDRGWIQAENNISEKKGKDGVRFEAINHRKDGTTFPVEISSSVMEIGGSRFYQLIIRDATERKGREQALEESQKQLRFLSSKLLIVGENERRRVSLELHDDLGQALILLKFKISSLAQRFGQRKPALRDDCDSLSRYVDGIIEKVRRISQDLSPAGVEELGLSYALKNLVDEFCEHFDPGWCAINVDDIDKLFSIERQINIYRIFQETMTNIVRHSQADQITIDIKRHNDFVNFRVQDNGKGFDVKQVLAGGEPHKGIGITAISERVRILGGSLNITSNREGLGTTITFHIPVEKGGADHATLPHHTG